MAGLKSNEMLASWRNQTESDQCILLHQQVTALSASRLLAGGTVAGACGSG